MNGDLICGGNSAALGGKFSDCLSFSDSGTWEVTHSLPYSRRQHSSWKVDNGVILIGTYSMWGSAVLTIQLEKQQIWSEMME